MAKTAAERGSASRPGPGVTMALKLDVPSLGGLGPGKIRLLELIDEHGSISAAGRAIDMSYRRAWDIVDSLNRMSVQPMVLSSPGGSRGGGAQITPAGHQLIRCYRNLQRKAARAVSAEMRQLDRLLGIASASTSTSAVPPMRCSPPKSTGRPPAT